MCNIKKLLIISKMTEEFATAWFLLFQPKIMTNAI